METQALAAYLASEFNKIKPSSAKNILFVEVSVVQAAESDGKPIYYNVEKLLSDYKLKFTKWCNNSGNKLVYYIKKFKACLKTEHSKARITDTCCSSDFGSPTIV